MQFKREDFPAIYEFHATRQGYLDRFEDMLQVLNTSLEQGSIRNVELKDLKSSAARFAEEALKHLVSEPFFYGGKWESQPKEAQDVQGSMYVAGIHSLISIKKKVDAIKVESPCVDAMRQWVKEYLPLALAVEELKLNVVMGRAPGTGPAKPVNPNKDVKTCPCCFRPIAVVSGTMAHHGYKRTGHGYQTQSCPGIRFQPLELSPDGMKYMLTLHTNSKEACEKQLLEAPEIKSFKTEIKRQMVEIDQADPRFKAYYNNHVHGLERDIRWHVGDIKVFETRIAAWRPDMKHKQVAPEDDSPSP